MGTWAVNNALPEGGALVLDAADLDRLIAALAGAGYRVIGPTVRDGAIVLAELGSAADLPFGWGVSLEPGGYRIRRRGDTAAFGHSAGPQSWKLPGAAEYEQGPKARRSSAQRLCPRS